MFKLVFLLGSSVSALLSFVNLQQWVAIATVFMATMSTLKEFNDTQGKISRYNGTVDGLDQILLSWYSMTDVERSSPVEIEAMVEAVERILSTERQAWSTQPDKEEKKDKEDDKSINKAKTIDKK